MKASRVCSERTKFQENEDDKFSHGAQLLRVVGGPGTGKTTALTQLWRYIFDHLDELVDKLSACDDVTLTHLVERVRSSLRPDNCLVFTFSNAG